LLRFFVFFYFSKERNEIFSLNKNKCNFIIISLFFNKTSHFSIEKMDQTNMLKFILLALALPGQYFIAQYWSNNPSESTNAIRK
jgi:hypothetical protein